MSCHSTSCLRCISCRLMAFSLTAAPSRSSSSCYIASHKSVLIMVNSVKEFVQLKGSRDIWWEIWKELHGANPSLHTPEAHAGTFPALWCAFPGLLDQWLPLFLLPAIFTRALIGDCTVLDLLCRIDLLHGAHQYNLRLLHALCRK